MKTKDFVQLRGEFIMKVIDKKGRVIETYKDKNLIVNAAKTSLAALLAGTGANKQVTKIAFGDNATAPAGGDTFITNSVTKALGAATYPEFNSVLFPWTLDYAEGNGLNITESGLLSNDNTLFARKVRSVIAKTADIKFVGTWKIIF